MLGNRGQESTSDVRASLEELAGLLDADPAGPVVILAESEDGSIGKALEQIPPEQGPVRHVAASPASRGLVGCVATELELEAFSGGVLAVDNAQWADPTSLGRLQRLLEDPPGPLVLFLGHGPLDAIDRAALDQVIQAGARHGVVHRVETEEADSIDADPLDDRQRDLALAARLVASSLGVGSIARFLDVTESDALGVAESLVASGLLRETRAGFLAAPAAHRLAAGEARLGYLSSRLAEVLEETDAVPGVVGSLWLEGGDAARAYPLLRQAALEAAERSALGEAYHMASRALEAAGGLGNVPRSEAGELHLVCGRFLRAAGRSEDAAEHLERAVGLLEGVERIDALGFAAAVADDRQHPQEAERVLALAGLEALRAGEPAKHGSLGTFQARALNRIGYADEADRMLAVSLERLDLAAAGSAPRFNGEMNRAWILFDRGQMREAETAFTHLRDLTADADLAGLADKEAWRARALFGSGRPAAAMQAVAAARRLADQARVEAPLFVADLALSEGNLAYGRPEEALAAAERVRDLVDRQLPAWENVARAEKARALLALGRADEAAAEIRAALAVTPKGADGWRWRARCRAIQMEVEAAASGAWPQREAEDLADMLLQSRLFGWAAELMCVIAEHSRDPGFAEEALAIANQVGNPMLAARAASAGKLWRERMAAPTVRALKVMETDLPEGWGDKWTGLAHVQQALAAPEVTGEEDAAENAAVLDRALRRAGLSGDEVLSPAQRRRRGLVRRRRTWRPMTVAAAALGVVALAGLTSFAIGELNQSPPGVTVVREVVTEQGTVTTAPPTLEETAIPLPDGVDFLGTDGTVTYRGDHGRSGYVDASGPRSFGGHYWTFNTAGQIEAAPVAYGRNLLVGGTDNTFYALGLSEGNIAWTLRTDASIATAADAGSGPIMEGNPVAYTVIADTGGSIRLRDPLQGVAAENWARDLGSSIVGAPVLHEGMIYAATTDGFVFGVDTSGNVIWQFPAANEPGLGTIRADVTFVDGVVYVVTAEGGLHLLDSTGQEICRDEFSAGILTAPIVTDGVTYILTLGNTVYVRPAGACTEASVEGRLSFFTVDAPIEVAPAIVGDAMYLPAGRYLYKLDLTSNSYIWPGDTVVADSPISAPPVVTNDTVYFGTVGGAVHAVDVETGEELGVWETGNIIRGQPLVIDHALYVASGNGTIYAIGE
ncbi:MAG TPA: PQQ-binding-like beta-propeller repeat protein [Acidimicrobiia bacterium]|nr:PQQ-binding-like beta-propeller repeat protein [Acidimicrobiia bacterium]